MISKYTSAFIFITFLLQSCTDPRINQDSVDSFLNSNAQSMNIRSFDLDSIVIALKFDSVYGIDKAKVIDSKYFNFFIYSMKIKLQIIGRLSDNKCGFCLSGKNKSAILIAERLVGQSVPEGEFCFSSNEIDLLPDKTEQYSKIELHNQIDTLLAVYGDGDVRDGLTTNELFINFKKYGIKLDSQALNNRFFFLKSKTYDWLIDYKGRCQPPVRSDH